MLQRTVEIPDGVDASRASTARGAFATFTAAPATDTPTTAAADSAGSFLLLTGFTGGKEDFAPLLPLLARAGRHAATYDQRGQHESPAGPGADFSLEALAADAHAVATALDLPRPWRLLGHSFGGLVAQAAVLRDPGDWSHLTLLCSGPGAFTDADGPEKRRDLPRLRELLAEQPIDVVHDIRQRHARAHGEPEPPPQVADLLRRRFVTSSPVGLSAVAGHLLEAPDLVDEVAATGVPVAVVRGADDDAWSWPRQDDMAARLGTTVTVVPDAAHSPAVENPAGLAAALLG